jgi:hypothetical protein
MKMAADGLSVIRIDDPTTIICQERVTICYYCCTAWKGGGKYGKCGKCGVATYCSKECQAADWKDLGHRDICKLLK